MKTRGNLMPMISSFGKGKTNENQGNPKKSPRIDLERSGFEAIIY